MKNHFQDMDSTTYKKIIETSYSFSTTNFEIPPSINNEKNDMNLLKRRIFNSLAFSVIAFIMFFLATIGAIRYLLLISEYVDKKHPTYNELYHALVYLAPLVGGVIISVSNHFFRYSKPFNDGILFFSSALTAYFLLDNKIPYKEHISEIAKLIFGTNYQYATSLFLATCLIGKTLIAFSEFFYEQKKHILKKFK